MNIKRFSRKLIFPILLLICMWPISASTATVYEEQSTEDMSYVRGIVSRVYPDKMQISVKPAKGKRVRITIDLQTILEGVSHPDEFEKGQQLKVWYHEEGDVLRAVKIEKMMELGC